MTRKILLGNKCVSINKLVHYHVCEHGPSKQFSNLNQTAQLTSWKIRTNLREVREVNPSPWLSRCFTNNSDDQKHLKEKLSHYSQLSPVPMSIAEFVERGGKDKIPEESSYNHLVGEVLVRLAHLIIELQYLPQEIREEDGFNYLYSEYMSSFSQVLQFEDKSPDPTTLRQWSKVLKDSKKRHADVVPVMASACMNMKTKYGIKLDAEDCALTRSIQYCLDRLYMSRISLNMLTNQHLMVYGHVDTIENQVGVIHPSTDIESVVTHAYQNSKFLCEQCYLTSPDIHITSQNSTSPTERVAVPQVPSHIYHMVFEIMKNAMQAIIEKHIDQIDEVPAIKVFICQSNTDVTIRVSDLGGGISRDTTDKIFKYLYTTSPRASLTSETVPLSGLGYGLPLARLYARYFQGDIRVASYEGHGTDVYVYLQALAGDAVERLPVWSPTSCSKMTARSSPIPDWTSKSANLR